MFILTPYIDGNIPFSLFNRSVEQTYWHKLFCCGGFTKLPITVTEYKFQGICSKLKKARLPSRPVLGNSIKSTAWTCPELFWSFKLMHTISETKKKILVKRMVTDWNNFFSIKLLNWISWITRIRTYDPRLRSEICFLCFDLLMFQSY